ncbi:MAG: hypothetical protein JRJ84_09495 [Deltaproteobacteria bacterium]|nr:hypothetical protein [Deltaproteobacteria bacterium]
MMRSQHIPIPSTSGAALYYAYNQPRFRSVTQKGIHESYFLRANHPTEPRAVWLKATVLVPLDGAPVAEVWCLTFDGDRTWGARRTVPLEEAIFSGEPLEIEFGGCRFVLGAEGGEAVGTLENAHGTRSWNLRWSRVRGALGRPLCILPSRRMLGGIPLPKTKPVTPSPVLRFEGEMRWDGEVVPAKDWLGSQGHNWGRGHQFQHAWAQVVFRDGNGEPHAMVEAGSVVLPLGGRFRTPPLATMVVRRGEQTFRFLRSFHFWQQDVHLGDLAWSVRLRSPDGEAMLAMKAVPERTQCLGYHNPDGVLSYCLNSKIAQVVLRVNPVNQEGFECTSEHGGALEFVSLNADPRFPDPV